MEKLENSNLVLEMTKSGGELLSIKSKKTGIEYLWNGEEKHWPGHAPILFPFVGRLKDQKFSYDGKTYEFPFLQHGFARKMNFEVAKSDDKHISYMLTSTDETYKTYPFKFELYIDHTLDQNKVTTAYKVINTDDKPILFKIGGHPGYMCPMKSETKFDDYYLEFEQNETLDSMLIDGGLMSRNTFKVLDNEKVIKLTYDLFKNDALIFNDTKSKYVCLKSDKHPEYIKFDFDGYKTIAFWTKKDAPFVCLEPWFGHTDFVDTKDELESKPGVIKLEPSKQFDCRYIVEVCE